MSKYSPKQKFAAAEVMTVPEVAEKLGIGRNAAYEAVRTGQIPAIRIGRLLRVPRIAFERMLDQAGAVRGQNSEAH